ncbi:MFS transporter [Desulfoluna sp.]|uniref:MFS transporter n=1 Tax=Desulfoluna sp. TaxID=2045199 RepID=UPI002635EDD9|nr:MFS transporter [Desulfoluna sp.]
MEVTTEVLKGPPVEETSSSGRGLAWSILLTLVTLNVFNYADRSILSIAIEAIKIDLGFSDTQMGALQTVLYIGVGLITLPAGVLVDRWSRKKALALMGFLWSLATVGTASVHSFVVMMMMRFGCGAGESSFHPGGAAWLSAIFSKETRARVISLMHVGAFIGSIFGVVLGGYLIASTGNWRVPFYVFGAPGFVLAMILVFIRDPAPVVDKVAKGQSLFSEFKEMVKVRSFLFTIFGAGFVNVLFITMMSWLPALIMRSYGINEARLGAVMGIAFVPGAVAPLIAGFLADKFQARRADGRPLLASIIVAFVAVGAVLQFWFVGQVSLTVFTIMLAIFTFVTNMTIVFFQVITMDVMPLRNRGKAASLCVLVMFLGFSWWGSLLVGMVSDMYGGGCDGLRIGMLALCPFPFMGSVFYYIASRFYPADSAAADEMDLHELATH